MNPYARNAQLAAYQSVSVHGGVDSGDPHRLVLMLMDGVMERLAKVRGCIERNEVLQRTRLLHSCVVLVSELRGALNLPEGGELAGNLNNLYEYMVRRLLLANIKGDLAIVTEITGLMTRVRDGWVAIGPEVRQGAQPARLAAVAG